MFKWTTTSFINGTSYLNGEPEWFAVNGGTITYADGTTGSTTNKTEKSFTVNRNVKFFKDNVTSITKAKWSLPELAELEIDFAEAALEAGQYRLYLYIRSIGNADPFYANDFIYKGRPLYIEFKAKGTPATDAENFKKTANKWIKLLYGNGDFVKVTQEGTVVTVKATDEYQKFFAAEIQKYDSQALVWAKDGAFVTLFSSDKDSEAYDADVFEVTKAGKPGFGTYVQLTKDLRLPTNANTRYFRDQEDAMPLVTGKYWQYVVTQCTERPEMQGTSVLGQYNKSITTHVIFVEDGVQSAFDSALSTFAGSEIEQIKTADEKKTESVTEPEDETVTYTFTSWDPTGTTKYGEGTVQTTGNTSNGKTEVEVTENASTDPNAQDFTGMKFWVASDATADGTTLYPLYDAEGNEVGISVKISE